MKSTFGARRRARKIGQDDDDEADADSGNASSTDRSDSTDQPVVVRKQGLLPQSSSRPKKKSALRLSFGPGESQEEAGEASSDTFTPKKSNLSRQAIEKNAARKAQKHGLPTERLPIRPGESDDRPSYSRDYLNELKSSTPSTPRDLNPASTDEEDDNVSGRSLDVASRMSGSVDFLGTSAIPTNAEIQEKKQRRARLAQEEQFVSLDDGEDDEDENEISLRPRQKWAETRLVREDEDLGEGFDEFVEDGKITLGKNAEKAENRRRRVEMEEMINQAEQPSDEESDDSDAERKAAYDAAQTRAGTYGSKRTTEERSTRPRTPPKITPIPTLSSTLERLQTALTRLDVSRMQKAKKLEELIREKAQIVAREVEIQRLLKESGEKYERLQAEAAAAEASNGSIGPSRPDDNAGAVTAMRGLESFGNTPTRIDDNE